MNLLIPGARRLKTGSPSRICFAVDPCYEQALRMLFSRAQDDRIRLELSLPRIPRSTGDRSQNHHINGHIQHIAQDTGNDFGAVKMYLKHQALTGGYPFTTLPSGEPLPKSESEISVQEATILIDVIHRFAAEWGIILNEAANG